jgi:hypothetical protein
MQGAALTTPALLSQRERREKGRAATQGRPYRYLIPLSPSGREGPGE